MDWVTEQLIRLATFSRFAGKPGGGGYLRCIIRGGSAGDRDAHVLERIAEAINAEPNEGIIQLVGDEARAIAERVLPWASEVQAERIRQILELIS